MSITYHQRKSGFTLIHSLFSLFITMMIVFSSVQILYILKGAGKHENLNIYLSIIQIRELLLDAKHVRIEEGCLYYEKEGVTYEIYEIHHLLIKKPGTDILIRDIEDVSFVQDQQKIYLNLKQFGKEKKFLIAFNHESTHETF